MKKTLLISTLCAFCTLFSSCLMVVHEHIHFDNVDGEESPGSAYEESIKTDLNPCAG